MPQINLTTFDPQPEGLEALTGLTGLTHEHVIFISWILEKGDTMVYVQDGALTYLWVENPIDNWLVAEMVGHTDYTLGFPADVLEHLLVKKNKVITTGTPLRGEHWITGKDDKSMYVRYFYKRIDFTDGTHGLLGVETDLTPRRYLDHASQALTRRLQYKTDQLAITEQRFRAALEGGPVSFFVIDDQLRYIWGYNFLDGPAQDQLGRTDEEFGFDKQEADKLTELKWEAFRTGKEVTYERWVRLPHTDEVGYYLSTFKRYDFGDGRTGLVGKVINLTKEKLLEQELENTWQKAYAHEAAEAALRDARALQLALMPDLSIVPKGCRVSAEIELDGMGGDYYDFMQALPVKQDPVGRCWLVLGDGVGNGLKAGIISATAKSLLYGLRHPSNKPCEILEGLSKKLNEVGMVDIAVGLHLVAFWPVPNRDDEYFLITASAGMPPYFVARAETGQVETIVTHGPTLTAGLQKHEQFDEHDLDMAHGDMLVLVSNGITDATDPAGEPMRLALLAERIAQTFKDGPDAVTAGIKALRRSYTGKDVPDDDATCLALQFS